MANGGNPDDLANLLAHERERRGLMETRITRQEDNVSQMLELLLMHFLALNMYIGNISSSTDQKLNRLISMMEHLLSSGEMQVNPAMDSSYPHNYGRYEDSHYYNVNRVDKPEKPQIDSEEDQPLVLVQPPTLLCTFGKPYKGVEKVLDELLNLKEGVHVSMPKYVDAPFVVDISKGEGDGGLER
ncbi:hypothetical protein Syun_007336 [Stephania yunnanensis]|uniref:Uncharacterized protein n=1 Tax=Stephania yunnanensis TaxID=152371 RepID=A0AAP0L0X0_9MAGN